MSTPPFDALRSRLDGECFTDELHRQIYATDASIYRKLPRAVVLPKNEEDLQKILEFSVEHHIPIVPRAAGTSLAGQCVGEGIIVDVSKYFTGIGSVNTSNKTITVQPGVIRDELNKAIASSGLFFGPNTSTSNRCMIGGMVGNNSSGTTSIKYGVTRDKVLAITGYLSDGTKISFSEMTAEAFHEKRKLPTKEGAIYQTLYTELSKPEVQQGVAHYFPKPEIHRRNTGYAIDRLLESEVFSDTDKRINPCHLICGSEGTLFFITEITLQLDPLPPTFTAMVVPQYNSLSNCLNDVVIAMQHDLYACEMMDDVILDCTKNNKTYEPYRFFVSGEPKALLLLEVKDDSRIGLEEKVAALLTSLSKSKLSYTAPVLTGIEIDQAMELRKAGLGLLGNMIGDNKAVACIEDTAVALSDLPSYIEEFTQLMDSFQQQAVYYAHAGAGELHLRPILNLKKPEGIAQLRKITTEVAKLTQRYQGSFSGEHGDGIVRAEFLPMLVGEAVFQSLKAIKKAFDPNHLLNPGKITDAWPMDASLRTDPDRETPAAPTLMNFDDSLGITRLAEKCNGSGDCRKTAAAPGAMCPSYHVTKNEKDSTRGRANVLRETLYGNQQKNAFDSEALKAAFDLCIGCKACASECPSNVDMATAKIEFLYQYQKTNGTTTATKRFAKSRNYQALMARFPAFSRWILQQKITAAWIKNSSGIAPERSLPLPSTKTFSKIHKKLSYNMLKKTKRTVFLYVDEFSNYADSEIALDAFELLRSLQYEVVVVHGLDSARALLSKGFLEEAQRHINKTLSVLTSRLNDTDVLLGIEPSAILGFRDEFLRLAEDRTTAQFVADRSFLIEEFLAAEIATGAITSDAFTSEEKNIKIHVHCHQKALSTSKATFDVLNLPVNYHPTLIPSGCCGMAGSFGYEKEHYKLSMSIGELKLFPAVRKASQDTLIAANGTSCRHQIKDGTQREALHPVSILRQALVQFGKSRE
ncbi:FAD-binding and (Fe-S)-binding domain-containing protein [Altibacter sp. HG106]|uniref:FAD-binding and (Fe-S)-binding domain-containing protein n=1 Tax=Altibacter sp. HG106 TaxID=3023937 RepID=UPI002350A8CC|nr:FAD-binding and (Fe-S)-binding domain-containing protein [Altibacter sp. HG106]MDC7993497.1 FAD-binding and (Fe-S)-binding domain-containing protein [Altibacter sp. HG106]